MRLIAEPEQLQVLENGQQRGEVPGGGGGGNLVVLFGESGRCHFCRDLFPDKTSLQGHLRSVHQPPRHALCDNCENFFHICAIQRHRSKCEQRYNQTAAAAAAAATGEKRHL